MPSNSLRLVPECKRCRLTLHNAARSVVGSLDAAKLCLRLNSKVPQCRWPHLERVRRHAGRPCPDRKYTLMSVVL